MTEARDPFERTLELLLYAPLGVGLFLKDAAPGFVDMFVSRGRAEIDRRHGDVQQRVTTARSLGQVALAFGPPMLRQRAEQTVAGARERAEQTVVVARERAEGLLGTSASEPASAPAPPTNGWRRPVPAVPAPAVSMPAAPPSFAAPPINGDIEANTDLPIPGYDALSASQVVERLMGLSRAELEVVHAYESAQRQRRTILGKIEQLVG
jgi:hypothetical protein